ncbi:hypothetical protein RJ55_08665 [Drechmeria coniospora]|nr:hypothetical protein RJ55_08665 [Drechmeria coniospora]
MSLASSSATRRARTIAIKRRSRCEGEASVRPSPQQTRRRLAHDISEKSKHQRPTVHDAKTGRDPWRMLAGGTPYGKLMYRDAIREYSVGPARLSGSGLLAGQCIAALACSRSVRTADTSARQTNLTRAIASWPWSRTFDARPLLFTADMHTMNMCACTCTWANPAQNYLVRTLNPLGLSTARGEKAGATRSRRVSFTRSREGNTARCRRASTALLVLVAAKIDPSRCVMEAVS